MDYCERLAQRIVQSAMPELEMRFNVNQSGSVADFSLSRFGEPIGALEVTRFTDQKCEELSSIIRENLFIARQKSANRTGSFTWMKMQELIV